MSRLRGLRTGLGIGVVLCVGFSLAPYLWFLSTSLKTPVEITAVPPRFWPSGTLSAYRSALVDHGLARYMANSLIVALATTVTTLLLASPAGYALVRLPIAGRRWILGLTLAAAMFPQVAIAGPVWRILRALGLLNTLPGLVLPHVSLTLPLAVWLTASFFKDLPPDLEEAARVDGCSRLSAFYRVIAPLAAPGLFTTAILVFIYSWNEFFFALLVLSDPTKQTLPVGIALFPGQYTMPWGEIAAASLVATLPLIALVLPLQRRIVHGLVAGALKG
ncbi:MAG TPA: carbohydrate ABC transporter permease [Candidatus Binatia bacterium]|nr:carbohydrate ABC transporter permease [Candidatus Binatia bacterium]